MSDWNPDPLLSSRTKVPNFLRTQWDEATARSFGPWRVAQPVDPTATQTVSARTAQPADAPAPAELAAPVQAVPTAAPVEPKNTWTEAAIAAVREEARQQGIQEGLQQAREQWEAERQRERQVLRHLGIELRSLQQDPQRFFEPLKRLALHIAEQWVRGELQVSGRAIAQLVRQCLAELDPNGQKVLVDLSPDDLQRLQAMGEPDWGDLVLQADPQLRDGSVRVRVHESVVQDLIEHRLEAMASQLLRDPSSWLQHSTLVHPQKVAQTPEQEGVPKWARSATDVEDATPKRVQSDPAEPADGGA